jgi:predicted methyltransferase
MARRLVASAQAFVAPVLEPGALAVDATVGRGSDTCFLAERVGAEGRVLGVDLQRQALTEAAGRLGEAGLAGRVVLRRCGHAHLQRVVPATWQGHVAAVMFNLGYLPGGAEGRVTRPATTRAALDAALALLRPGGRLSVLAYRGHAGGPQEAETVRDWAGRQAPDRLLWELEQPTDGVAGRSPWWLAGQRPAGEDRQGGGPC